MAAKLVAKARARAAADAAARPAREPLPRFAACHIINSHNKAYQHLISVVFCDKNLLSIIQCLYQLPKASTVMEDISMTSGGVKNESAADCYVKSDNMLLHPGRRVGGTFFLGP